MQSLKNHLILSASGGGKTLLASSLVKVVKQYYPECTVFYITCEKQQQKDAGSFELVDVFKATNPLTAPYEEIIDWFIACINEFDKVTGEKLLILDSYTLLVHIFKSNKSKYQWLQDKIITYLSIGGSAGIKVWFLATNPNVNNLGLNSGIAIQLIPLVIIQPHHASYYSKILAANIIPKHWCLGFQKIVEVSQNSPVGRAIYDGTTDKWKSMSSLTL